MTKKDYELIARVLRYFVEVQLPQDEKDLLPDEVNAMRMAHNDIARSLAFELQNTNERFDENRFLTACGIQD